MVWRFTEGPVRLDMAVAQGAGASRAKAQTWIVGRYVQVDGRVVTKPAFRLLGTELLEVDPPPEAPSVVEPEELELEILFEDQDLLVVNKPAGMITHPAPGVRSGTLVNAVLGRYAGGALPAPGGRLELVRPGIVHRLDKDTSGVIVVARHEAAHRRLAKAFHDRRVAKRYLAITEGVPATGELSAPVGRHPLERTRMHVGGVAPRFAITDFDVLAEAPEHALVEARPHTGRTHQIRVHLKYLRAPVLGDVVYGRPSPLIGRQALHAWILRLPHPRSGEIMQFTALPPPDMSEAWMSLGGAWPF